MDNIYFAMLPPEQIAEKLYEKVTDYYDEIQANGRLGLWRKVYKAYYALDDAYRHEAAQVNRGGEQGELSLLKANHFRNLLTHLHVLVTQQKTVYECRSLNTDSKSQMQTILGSNVLEHYLREEHLEDHFRQLAEYCLKYGEGYVCVKWNQSQGAPVTAAGGKIVKTGDIEVTTHGPEVIRDCKPESDLRPTWFIVPDLENKYELAAQYPKYANEILNYEDDKEYFNHTYFSYSHVNKEHDRVPVYTLYHDKTDACPQGRYVKFIGSRVVLEYGMLPYESLQIHRMAAYNQDGTSFGYSVSFDLLCVQEAIDRLYSTVLSNQSSFGVQNIWMKPGSNVSPMQVAGGLNVIVSNEKPEPINLTYTPPEITNFLKTLETLGEMLSGVNSVARGQPEASLKSGAALAMIASQAIQFSNGIQAAYTKVREEVGTSIIKTLQQKATLPRIAAIVGKSNQSYIKEYTGKDLQSINRAIVDVGNPMSQTIAGRIQMGQDLLQSGTVKDPSTYIQLVTTGRLEPMLDEEKELQILINSENEKLKEGIQVPITILDRHTKHILGHYRNIADPDVRSDPVRVQATLEHIQEHINMLKTTDPVLLNLLGEPTNLAMPPPPGAPIQGQGANAPQPNAQPPEQSPTNQAPTPPNTPPQIADSMPAIPQSPTEQIQQG